MNNFMPIENQSSAKTTKIAKSKFYEQSIRLEQMAYNQINIHFNIFHLIVNSVCPCVSWKKLKVKKYLLGKAREKLFFQLDVLNYLKKMQLLELLVYALLEPEENTILQFLSKPSISLAQKTDIYDRIHQTNNFDFKEIDELYTAVRKLASKSDKTEMQKRLFNITRSEMGLWIKRIKEY